MNRETVKLSLEGIELLIVIKLLLEEAVEVQTTQSSELEACRRCLTWQVGPLYEIANPSPAELNKAQVRVDKLLTDLCHGIKQILVYGGICKRLIKRFVEQHPGAESTFEDLYAKVSLLSG